MWLVARHAVSRTGVRAERLTVAAAVVALAASVGLVVGVVVAAAVVAGVQVGVLGVCLAIGA